MSNAYDSASLLVTPNGYKASKIYSAKPTDGTGDLAFSRASTAMRRNSAGLWEEVANNVPRLQYPVGGGCPSWLFEPQATNLVSYNTSWAAVAVQDSTITANAVISPTGGVTAATIKELATTANHDFYFTESCVSGQPYTQSIRVKPDGRTWGGLFFLGINGVFTASRVWFNLTGAGSIGTINAGITASIELDSEGYYFIQATRTAEATNTGFFGFFLAPSDNVSIYAGDITKGANMWAYQVENKSTASSPILTVTSAVTRLADSPQAKAAPTNLQDFSIIMKGISLRDVTETNTLFGDLSTSDSSVALLGSFVLFSASGAGDTNCGSISISNNTPFNLGVVRSGAVVKVFKDGSLISTTTATSTTFILDGFWVYNLSGLNPLKGLCKDCELYEIAISDLECQNLTTL
jgi:hypothetical protein